MSLKIAFLLQGAPEASCAQAAVDIPAAVEREGPSSQEVKCEEGAVQLRRQLDERLVVGRREC